MIVIKADLNYIDDILEIENESFIDPLKKEDLIYEINDNPFSNFLLLKNDENKIVGYYNFWITFDSATIYRIAIKKSERNKGFARFLLQYGEKMLKEKGVEFLTLEVRTSNTSAINLYKSFGFQIITLKEHYYENGEDAYYMMKGLI